RAHARELDVPAGSSPGATTVRDVRLELARGALVGGTVRDARGQRLAGAHVTVRRADGSGDAVEADSDAQGEFRLRDCPAGEVVVTATHGDRSGAIRATVRGGDEVLGLALELR
ncbi:MAG: carboxypeptidase-like regulatory domain-containing protein, partial [Acidobacteriota bacterium]